MIILTILLGVVVAGLLLLVIVMQKRVASTLQLKGSLEAAETALCGKDELLAQKDELLRQKDNVIAQRDELLRRADIEASRSGDELRKLQTLLDGCREELSQARSQGAALKVEVSTLRERAEAVQAEREKNEKAAAEHFRNVANEIFEQHTRSFKENSENRLQEILQPLKNNIEEFRKAVNTAYSEEAKERYSLQNEIRNLMELNRTIGKEAQDLTRALKGDSKVQGDWGEMILERMLEMSGLQKGYHFETQVTVNADGSKITGEDGRALRPDVVVNYPDGRCVVIDSKVSLSAYIDYVNAESNREAADEAARRHLLSVRRHVAELAEKKYQDLVGDKRLDFVMMFIPNEGAYFAMMRLEPGIWEEAYKKRVLLTSPTHLISVLKMLEQLWRQDAINKNVQEIARLSGTMLDKFVNFMGDMDNIEKHLDAAHAAYSQARKRLGEGNGNVMVTARKIVALGAKTTKAAEIRRIAPDEIAEEGVS